MAHHLLFAALAAVMIEPSAWPAQGPPAPVVTGTLVSDADGSPLEGAQVAVCAFPDPDTRLESLAAGRFVPVPVLTTVTDEAGRFSLAVATKGPAYLIARAAGHAGSSISRPFTATARDLGVIRLPEGRTISGRLVAPDGSAVTEARVVAIPQRRDSDEVFEPTPLPAETVPDENGRFTLEDVGVPKMLIWVWADGMALEGKEYAQEPDGLVIHLQPAVKISGTVLTPGGDSPVPGAWVTVRRAWSEVIARADDEGRFVVDRLWPDKMTLSARAPRSTPATSTFAPSARMDLDTTAANPVTLRLLPGAHLRARVVDAATGLPLPAARIELMNATGIETLLTDEAGEADFPGAAPGSNTATVMAEGYAKIGYQTLTVGPGEDRGVGFRLERTAVARGVVRSAKDGEPVQGAALLAGTLYDRPIGVMRVDDSIDLGEPVSDAGGGFTLDGLPAGKRLLIEARLPGYARSRIEIDPLKPGERREGLELRLEKGMSITGRVVDEDNNPIGGAQAVAVDAAEAPGDTMLMSGSDPGSDYLQERPGTAALPGVTSGEDGAFEIVDAAPGRWSLVVKADGFVPRVVHGVVLEEAPGAHVEDVILQRGARIRGRVVDAAGSPPDDFFIRLFDEADATSSPDIEEQDDGSFESVALPAGRSFTLSVSADGFIGAKRTGVTPPVDGLVITLDKGASIAGNVLDAKTRAPVTDFGVTVGYGEKGGILTWLQESGPSDTFRSETGRFELGGIRPGPVRLEVQAAGYVKRVVKGLDVRPEGQRDDVTVLLERSLILTGIVVDESGHPIGDVRVSSNPVPGSGISFSEMLTFDADSASARTDTQGEFRLELPGAEPVRLEFSRDEYLSTELTVDPSVRREGLRVELRRGGVLSGVVIEDPGSVPVKGARVTASRSDAGVLSGSGQAVSGQDGSFSIEGLRPGTYDVKATAAGLIGGEPSSVVVTESGRGSPVTLTLRPGTRLLGTILGPGPDEITLLSVRAAGAGSPDMAAVDREGRFEIDGLSSGKQLLLIGSTLSGAAMVTRTVEIPPGAPTWEVTIDLEEGFVVSGVVSRSGGVVANAKVNFVDRGRQIAATADTGADGAYALKGLTAGTYLVSVLDPKVFEIQVVGSVAVEGDRRFDIDLPSGRIAGSIVSADSGRPVPGAGVSIEPLGETSQEKQAAYLLKGATVDDEGRYAITGLPPGGFRLTARAAGYGFETKEVVLEHDGEQASASFVLSPAEALSLRVTLGSTGEPATDGMFILVFMPGMEDPLAAPGPGDQVVYQGLVQPDGSGHLGLDSLKPGSYDIAVWSPGLVVETLHGVIVPSPEIAVTLSTGSPVTLRTAAVPDGPAGRALLLDAAGQPARLQALLADPTFPVQKGQEGALGVLAPGTYTLRAMLPDGRTIQKTVVIGPGAGNEIEIP